MVWTFLIIFKHKVYIKMSIGKLTLTLYQRSLKVNNDARERRKKEKKTPKLL
jgi:hypothetical protein